MKRAATAPSTGRASSQVECVYECITRFTGPLARPHGAVWSTSHGKFTESRCKIVHSQTFACGTCAISPVQPPKQVCTVRRDRSPSRPHASPRSRSLAHSPCWCLTVDMSTAKNVILVTGGTGAHSTLTRARECPHPHRPPAFPRRPRRRRHRPCDPDRAGRVSLRKVCTRRPMGLPQQQGRRPQVSLPPAPAHTGQRRSRARGWGRTSSRGWGRTSSARATRLARPPWVACSPNPRPGSLRAIR